MALIVIVFDCSYLAELKVWFVFPKKLKTRIESSSTCECSLASSYATTSREQNRCLQTMWRQIWGWHRPVGQGGQRASQEKNPFGCHMQAMLRLHHGLWRLWINEGFGSCGHVEGPNPESQVHGEESRVVWRASLGKACKTQGRRWLCSTSLGGALCLWLRLWL